MDEEETFLKAMKEIHPELFPTNHQVPEGQLLVNTHPAFLCEGRGCIIHHPSDHRMKNWPVHFEFMDHGCQGFRYCQHRVGHTDPDDIAYYAERGIDISAHDCDGCCRA